MLLRFSVSNFRSFRDEQALSMVASALKDGEASLLETPALRTQKVLPFATIYGANASGKSNLISALGFMRLAVLNSHRSGEPGSAIFRSPFALDTVSKNQPSTFQIEFVLDSVRYEYGFAATDSEYIKEYLYYWPSGVRSTLFERSNQNFQFGRNLKGRNNTIKDLTRPNSLFLSAATQNNHEQLTGITEFFRQIEIDYGRAAPPFLLAESLDNAGTNRRIVNFLSGAETGIIDVKISPEQLDARAIEISKGIMELLSKAMDEAPPPDFESNMNKLSKNVQFGHKGASGETIFLNYGDESSGTLCLITLLGPVFRALDKGSLVVLDEFGASIHTLAAEAVVALFASKSSNPRGAQLIVATHDTNLLRSTLLRRDQIWFTEKDTAGATYLIPLTDIRTRKGDDIAKGYLQGRFGAIPFAGHGFTELETV